MDRGTTIAWVRRISAAVAVVLILALVAGTWIFSNILRGDLLAPTPWNPDPDLEVLAVGGGRITVTRTDLTEQDGVWGVVGENGYGQVSTVIGVDPAGVERSFRTLEGRFDVGDEVRFDQYAYVGDPLSVHGIPFEEERIPGELGSYPAWLVEGDRDTWVIFVHGKGLEERRQALRILPTLVEERLPVLVITYRNDAAAPPSSTGLYEWGQTEWRDVEAAMEFAQDRGAEAFVLIGYSMGGAVSAMTLHESLLTHLVRGVIFDSAVLDLGGVVNHGAAERNVPGILTWAAKAVSAIRFGIEWDDLDQVARADQFDVPILLMHGGADDTVPVEAADAFAAARPDLVTYERFAEADHVYLWNSDPVRYETAVTEFLEQIIQ